MGVVYRARDARLGRDVALKMLPPDVVADAARLERFSREARALAALNHPNIVTIYSTEESDGVPFLTMELVEGTSLDRMIRRLVCQSRTSWRSPFRCAMPLPRRTTNTSRIAI